MSLESIYISIFFSTFFMSKVYAPFWKYLLFELSVRLLPVYIRLVSEWSVCLTVVFTIETLRLEAFAILPLHRERARRCLQHMPSRWLRTYIGLCK